MTTETIKVKDAVKKAKEHLKELYQDDPPRDLALEEIEFVDDGRRKFWSVTLGFLRKRSLKAVNPGSIAAMLNPPAAVEDRVYKTVFVDASTGEFVKMDIRQVQ